MFKQDLALNPSVKNKQRALQWRRAYVAISQYHLVNRAAVSSLLLNLEFRILIFQLIDCVRQEINGLIVVLGQLLKEVTIKNSIYILDFQIAGTTMSR